MSKASNIDRHLHSRVDGRFRYVRRVPLDVLRSSGVPEKERYERTLARAKALQIEYRTVDDLIANASMEEIVRRVRLIKNPADRITVDAVLGGAGEKVTSLDEAFEMFMNVIRKAEMIRKSENQLRKWRVLKHRGLTNFKNVVGDIPVEKITRADANKFYEWWLARIAPQDKSVKPLTASSGNKDLDTMRTLVGEYLAYVKGKDTVINNPFAGVRRQGFWDNRRFELTEALVHQGYHFMLRLLGEASGVV